MNDDLVGAAKLAAGVLGQMTAGDRERLLRRWHPSWGEGLPESDEDAISWLREGGGGLLTHILRHVDMTNEELRNLVQAGFIKLPHAKEIPRPHAQLRAFSGGTESNASGVPLDQLAIMSTVVLELSLEVATALEPFVGNVERPKELYPPTVTVDAGSIQLTVGGPLLASGVGLAVATSAGILISPLAIPAASLLAAAGVVDLAIGWWKSIGEGEKARAEAKRLSVDAPSKREADDKRALDRRQQELAIQRAEMELAAMSGAAAAASRLISPEEVRRQAELWGFTEPIATHLLNRVLPKTIAVRKVLGWMDAVPTVKRGEQVRL
jgi:hypothetical protein